MWEEEKGQPWAHESSRCSLVDIKVFLLTFTSSHCSSRLDNRPCWRHSRPGRLPRSNEDETGSTRWKSGSRSLHGRKSTQMESFEEKKKMVSLVRIVYYPLCSRRQSNETRALRQDRARATVRYGQRASYNLLEEILSGPYQAFHRYHMSDSKNLSLVPLSQDPCAMEKG